MIAVIEIYRKNGKLSMSIEFYRISAEVYYGPRGMERQLPRHALGREGVPKMLLIFF